MNKPCEHCNEVENHEGDVPHELEADIEFGWQARIVTGFVHDTCWDDYVEEQR